MFNRQSAADDRLRARIARSKRELLPREVQRQLPVDSRAVLERYGVADALALRFAGTMRNVQLCIHGLALLGLASFEFFAHVQSDPNGPWQMTWLALALAFFLAAYLLYLWGAKFQDLYQDYRALAEGLRVQFFWRLADVDASVADYYLGKHRTELDWIRNALRNWSIPVNRLERDCRLDLALKYWVKDQYDYFRGRPDDEDARRISRCVKWCLVGAAVAALVYPSSLAVPSGGGWRTVSIITLATVLPLTFVAFLLSGAIRSIGKSWRHAAYAFGIGAILLVAGEIGFAAVRHSLKASDSDTSRTVVTLVIALLLVFAALVQHYGEKMGFREHAKLYRHMRDLFDRALRHMNRAHSKQLQQELLHDLGIFALEENGDWVMLHRERPLEVPFG
jgi:hypothetical protein